MAVRLQRVSHEIQGPYLVNLCGRAKRLPLACDEAPFGAPLMVEFHVAIHTVHFFVVPSFAILAHACEAFPKAPS